MLVSFWAFRLIITLLAGFGLSFLVIFFVMIIPAAAALPTK
jgi:hypothetical protein